MVRADLARPVRIGDQLAAHGRAVDAARGKLLLDKIGLRQSADAANRQLCQLAYRVAERQKAAFLVEIGMLCRRNGVG